MDAAAVVLVVADAGFFSVTDGDGAEDFLLSPVPFVSVKLAFCFLLGKHIQLR